VVAKTLLLRAPPRALHFAAKNGHVAAMELLLAHGADPMAEDRVRAPPGSLIAKG